MLKFYTNTSYYKFNQAAIKGVSESDIIEIERLLRNTLDRLKSSPGTYYRGIGKEEIAFLDSYKKGDIITYKNFMSTSRKKEKAFSFYKNNVKKTGEGAMIEVISKDGKKIEIFSDAQEWEVLHKSNSNFKLIDIEHDYIYNLDDVWFYQATPIKLRLYILKEL